MTETQHSSIEVPLEPINPINIEIRQGKTVAVPEWVAIELAREVCVDYVRQHPDVDEDAIDITKPSDKDDLEGEYNSNGFHMFLGLLKDIGLDAETIRTTLENEGTKYTSEELELHTSIAEERISSDDPKFGLNYTFDTRERRYKYEIGEFYKAQKIETNFMRLMTIRNGNEEAFTKLFNDDYFGVIVNELNRFNAPDEIVDLAEGAVRQLLKGDLRKIAQDGVEESIKGAIANLVAEQMPIHAAKIEKEKRELATQEAVRELKPASFIEKLSKFEELERMQEEEFFEKPVVEMDRKLIAEIVDAGKAHFLARAHNKADPPIESLNRLTNGDRRAKRLSGLRNQFIADFRSHIESSIYMKAQGIEIFDITDVFKSSADRKSHWTNLLNKLIDKTTEESQS